MDVAEFKQWLEAQITGREIKVIQQHHTFLPDYTHFTGSNHFDRMLSMRTYHMVHLNFRDIAQHFTTFPDGMVGICRPLNLIPAGIKGANARGICIEHFGNFDSGHDQMTPAHRDTIVQLTAMLCRKFSLSVDTESIIYHHWYDLNSGIRRDGKGATKTCPGTGFFGGNKVEDAQREFIPLVQVALQQYGQPAGNIIPQAEIPVEISGTGIVTASRLRVRLGPGTNYPVVNSLGAGAVVLIFESKNGWARINTDNHWISERFVLRAKRAHTTAGKLYIRTGPGSEYGKLGSLPRGTEVFIYDTFPGWCKIDLNDKWVSSAYLVYD